jgi:mRNA-degrading endonuclease RelE of RelBE toxin-antitoxin system
MKIALAPQFVRQYRQLSETDQQFCAAAVDALPGAFGFPHRHSGLSIRALRRGVYECRASQAVRIGFTHHGDTLLLHMVGNHDAMRTWLRKNA